MNTTTTGLTAAPVIAGGTAGVLPEFGRLADVQRIYGIKRGLAYLLMSEGKIKSVCIRRKGNVHGCRLVLLSSVRDYLHSLLENQESQSTQPEN